MTMFSHSDGVPRICSDAISEHLTASKLAKRVKGTLSLRKALRLSQSKFAAVIAPYTGRTYGRSALSNWERAEKRKPLPRGYWKKLAPPKKVREAMQRFVADLVCVVSRGRWCARVSGVRHWRVRLIAAKAVHS